jgi:hypothetical protein
VWIDWAGLCRGVLMTATNRRVTLNVRRSSHAAHYSTYIGWGQPPNPQEIRCFKWEFCVRFERLFQERNPGVKRELPLLPIAGQNRRNISRRILNFSRCFRFIHSCHGFTGGPWGSAGVCCCLLGITNVQRSAVGNGLREYCWEMFRFPFFLPH